MKYNLLIMDPPYEFDDKLKMSKVKRSSEDQYDGTLTMNDIKNLDIATLASDTSLLALWVPSAHIEFGMDMMKGWGFNYKQTFIWVKIKKDPLKELKKKVLKLSNKKEIAAAFDEWDANDILSMFMGRIFRQTHEVVLLGTKGKVNQCIALKNQRSVDMAYNEGHSFKPEGLQDRLEIMYPTFTNRVELFARRDRPGWDCAGNECPSTFGENIRDSIERLKVK